MARDEDTRMARTSEWEAGNATNWRERRMEREKQTKGGTFVCATCGLACRFDYFGKTPPFDRRVRYAA